MNTVEHLARHSDIKQLVDLALKGKECTIMRDTSTSMAFPEKICYLRPDEWPVGLKWWVRHRGY